LGDELFCEGLHQANLGNVWKLFKDDREQDVGMVHLVVVQGFDQVLSETISIKVLDDLFEDLLVFFCEILQESLCILLFFPVA
jgi:hypothetical protein